MEHLILLFLGGHLSLPLFAPASVLCFFFVALLCFQATAWVLQDRLNCIWRSGFVWGRVDCVYLSRQAAAAGFGCG